jgi:hypothetical protein
MGLVELATSCRTFVGSYDAAIGQQPHACSGTVHPSVSLHDPFWQLAALRYDEIAIPVPTPGWSYAAFVNAVGDAASGKKYVDKFEYLWSRQPGRPKNFDDRILARTMYILHPSLAVRARRAMDRSRDLLATFDGVLVLAPGWTNAHRFR